MKPKLSSEFNPKILKSLPYPLIGVDEVGRGCLAGPVCAGVVILNPENPSDHYFDSKTLSEEKRLILAEDIKAHHYWALGWASAEEIDEINIRQATFVAMGRALRELDKKYPFLNAMSGSLLIDGRDILPEFEQMQQRAIIKGDQHLRMISAASIVAKVARDQLMSEVAQEFALYGFEKHKGYGTLTHRKSIEQYGPTPHHRKTFGGVKEFITN